MIFILICAVISVWLTGNAIIFIGKIKNNGKIHECKKLQLEKEKQDTIKAHGDVSKFEEGEGEVFSVTIKRVANGCILQGTGNKKDHIMVFEQEKYKDALEFILHRRLFKMKEGEEIEFELTQRFTKIIKTEDNEKI
jgi:hypothetical protein